jgi:hypothetical protein
MVAPSFETEVSNGVVLVDCVAPEKSGVLTLEEMSQPTETWEPDALPPARPVAKPAALDGPEELLVVRISDPICIVPAAEQGWEAVARRKDYALWVKVRSGVVRGETSVPALAR